MNAVDDNGETAMHGAAYKSFPRVVQLLADKGAKVEVWNRKNKYGWTPLSIAEGHRPGNFKPSPETLAALHRVMLARGVSPAPAAPPVEDRKGYQPASTAKPSLQRIATVMPLQDGGQAPGPRRLSRPSSQIPGRGAGSRPPRP